MDVDNRKEKRAAFVALLIKVAEELGELGEGDVQFHDSTAVDDFRCSGKLVQGREFVIDVYGYNDGYSANAKERIKFSGSWPREPNGPYKRLRDYGIGDYNSSDPEISVSATGDAKRIAKDIQRRLIKGEDIRGKFAAVLAKQAESNAYASRKVTLAKELFAIAGEKPRERDLEGEGTPTLRLYEFRPGVSYGDVQVRGDDTVRFELTVNGVLAKKLLTILAGLKE